MRKILFVVLGFLSVYNLNAQVDSTINLQIYIERYHSLDSSEIIIELVNDSTKESIKEPVENYWVDFLNLSPGVYTLNVFDSSQIVLSRKGVKLHDYGEYDINLNISKPYYHNPYDTSSIEYSSLLVKLSYSPKNELYQTTDEYGWGFQFSNGVKLAGKFFSFAMNIGLAYERQGLTSPVDNINGNQVKNAFYNYWNIPTQLRFGMGRNKKKNELIQGLFLETGIQYNTPLYFRKVYSMDNNEKLFTRKLHMWNDLSVFTHIGYAPFFIHAGYRWNDFVKSNSPSFSSFNLGVGFDVNFAFNNR